MLLQQEGNDQQSPTLKCFFCSTRETGTYYYASEVNIFVVSWCSRGKVSLHEGPSVFIVCSLMKISEMAHTKNTMLRSFDKNREDIGSICCQFHQFLTASVTIPFVFPGLFSGFSCFSARGVSSCASRFMTRIQAPVFHRYPFWFA